MQFTVALFGEAQKGEFQMAYYCQTLAELSDFFGEPPSEECQGLQFAVQTLLYERGVIYFRVHEEGFSIQDYLQGFNFLEKSEAFPNISAIGLPGVGSTEIIKATEDVCQIHKSFLILTEQDLYDFLTASP
ncbi:MAG: hypothetical protein WAM28_08750 [Chlamydiales bacterium]